MSQYPTAHITINNNRVKNYSGKIYLQKDTEFEIEFFNGSSDIWLAKIKMNGNYISDSGLVLKPGQRIYLERYFDSHKKFKFDTYNVENTNDVKEAIKDNGIIDISFYKEKIKIDEINTPFIYDEKPFEWQKPIKRNDYTYNLKSANSAGSATYFLNTMTVLNNLSETTDSYAPEIERKTSKKIETGRIEKGSNSNQTFKYVDYEFESFPRFFVNFKLLPLSQKNIESEDIRIYCSNCGKKSRNRFWKYCPKCGNKIR